MSGQPPIISTETGTPASEWAQSTTTAAFAREDPAPAADGVIPPGVQYTQSTQSTVSTPGRDFPGAYPRASEYMNPSESSGVNTQVLGDAAKSAMQSVTNTAASVVDVVSSYIPGSNSTGSNIDGTARASEHDDSHLTSLPSTERDGALPREHVGGTGALPGTVSEEGVTKLPDERNVQPERSLPADTAGIATYPSLPYPSTAPYPSKAPSNVLAPVISGVPKTTTTTTTTAVTDRTSLPSQEPLGQQPFTHQDGAGSLPGKLREQSVAALPDETGGGAGATNATSSATGTHPVDYASKPALARPGEEAGNESLGLGESRAGRNVAGGVGALVGGKGEEGVAVLPDERGTTVSEGQKGDKLAEMDQSEREERHERQQSATDVNGGAKETHHAENKVSSSSSLASSADGRGGASAGDDGRANPEEGEGRETQMNLLHVNLSPRKYTLGAPSAVWHGVGVGTDASYQDGQGVDIEHRGEDEGDLDTNYHPAALHPASANAAQTSSETEGDATQEGNQEAGAGAGDAATGGEKAKKAGFLDKMKGEAKVLMGKMEGKKGAEKVQEGKRMKAGEQ